MADQSGFVPFQELSFESALQAYQKKTGITLARHPIALDLQSCHSVEDTTTLLQGRAQAVSEFRERHRIVKAIKNTVTFLTQLSDATSLTDAVRQKALMACSTSLTFLSDAIPTRKGNPGWSRYTAGCMCRSLVIYIVLTFN
jgi:hypothetical protein